MKTLTRILAVGAFALMATPASAAIIYTSLGTAAPPATLGGITMTPFADDARPNGILVTTVASPEGGDVTFSYPVRHQSIGDGWATWSHGYTGDVYVSDSGAHLSLFMPAQTAAFYLYVEPNTFAEFTFDVCSSTTCSGPTEVEGFAGAAGFGFHATGDDVITSVTIASLDQESFATGEFGIAAVPEPASMLLLGTGLIGAGMRRYRQRRAQA